MGVRKPMRTSPVLRVSATSAPAASGPGAEDRIYHASDTSRLAQRRRRAEVGRTQARAPADMSLLGIDDAFDQVLHLLIVEAHSATRPPERLAGRPHLVEERRAFAPVIEGR